MRLPFTLDPEIIHHVIHSQAGSIGKAIIELLMNAVDANATTVHLSMTKEGFECVDDGNGFASREDVVRYFGRFGTPHQDGDARYGRFRLGRGQIMAHASTTWESHHWRMAVDTRTMGYAYDLDDLDNGHAGCKIQGAWYEPLNDSEWMSAVQEVRDLVRYTPVTIHLNGQAITKDPTAESWDAEDDVAYYRVKAEGGVSIYNQGVLVRHDSGHLWGVGGLIVSKQPLALNVSRTEILRKTCPVWKPIAKRFSSLSETFSESLGSNRKTEVWREKVANDLLAGVGDLWRAFHDHEVVTVLPGRRHITLSILQRKGRWMGNDSFTVVQRAHDVPKGEQIAKSLGLPVVHPITLQRFGCHSPEAFYEVLQRVLSRFDYPWARHVPALIDFDTVKAAFVERTAVASDKDLDKETRRAWIALKWSLRNYMGACLGLRMNRGGACADPLMEVVLGDSNVAEAWTDGHSYVAFNRDLIQRLKVAPFETVSRAFALMEHELAHQGDSLSCGHDEAFYQRHHDLSMKMAGVRQTYIHKWMSKYAQSMANEGKGKDEGARVWREVRLHEAIGDGRQKRHLATDANPLSQEEQQVALPCTSDDLIQRINDRLIGSGACPPPPDWGEVERLALQQRLRHAESRRAASEAEQQTLADYQRSLEEQAMWERLQSEAMDEEDWPDEPEHGPDPCAPVDDLAFLPEGLRAQVLPGETLWSLTRNAAATGFDPSTWGVKDYLSWRQNVAP